MKTKMKHNMLMCIALAISITSCSKESETQTDYPESQKELSMFQGNEIEDTSFSAETPKDNRLIIDDFKSGPLDKLTFEDASAIRHIQEGGTIIGRFRQLFSRVNRNPFQQNMQLGVQDGLLVMTYAYDTRGTTYLNYGVDQSGLAPLNLRLEDENYTVLKVRFAAKSTINGIYVSMFTGTSRAVYSTHVPAREGVMDVTIPLNELEIIADDFDLNQVDYIRFQFDSRSKTGCSMAVDEIWFE